MNAFYEHHKDSISWYYRCFDRILLNDLIQPFQQLERVVGFFNTYRQLYPVITCPIRTQLLALFATQIGFGSAGFEELRKRLGRKIIETSGGCAGFHVL